MTDKHELQQALETVYDQFHNFDIRSYSGRGMFGKECLGVTVSRNGMSAFELIGRVVEAAADRGAERSENNHEFATEMVSNETIPIIKALANTQTDDMGLDMIIYWPDVPYVAGGVFGYPDIEDEDEDEEDSSGD
jgi:hypothetical protein